jgi:hypothetical protein
MIMLKTRNLICFRWWWWWILGWGGRRSKGWIRETESGGQGYEIKGHTVKHGSCGHLY